MSSAEAYSLLKPREKGAFLVRPSTKQEGSFVVSFKNENGKVIHALLQKDEESGGWKTDGVNRTFRSVEEVVQKYRDAGVYGRSAAPPRTKLQPLAENSTKK